MLWCLFFLALQQLTVTIGADGVSVSYLLLWILLFPYRRIVLTEPVAAVLVVYAVVFLVGAPALLTGDPNYGVRTTASFLSLNYASSEGARAYLAGLIFEYLAAHPWTGSNFAGLYLIYDELDGRASAHNQLTDVLLRTGAIGFPLYLWLLARIFLFFRRDRAILVGLVAVLIYGIFRDLQARSGWLSLRLPAELPILDATATRDGVYVTARNLP